MPRVLCGLWLAVASIFVLPGGAVAQDDVFDEVFGGSPAIDPDQPWIGWHGPFVDGLIGLRFGMDRVSALRVARDRDLISRAARDGQMRFEGEFLGEPAEVLLDFTEADDPGASGHLHRIRVQWNLFGLPQRPLALFGRLDGMLASRYGDPVRTQDDGFTALDRGDGLVRKLYFGPETRAQVDLQAYRPQRYYVILALENPQLTDGE